MLRTCRMLVIPLGLATHLSTLFAFVTTLPRRSAFLAKPSGLLVALEMNAAGDNAAKMLKRFEGNGEAPVRKQSLNFQSRLQEFNQRNLRGENLTQDYCDTTLGLCVAAEEWDSVLDVLEVMKSHNLTQEHSTFRSCLQQCFEEGNGASALEMLQAMDRALIEPHPGDIGLVAAAMCRNNRQEPGWWRKAMQLLLSRPSRDVPIDAYDAVLACLVDERNWKEAIRLLRRLENQEKRNLPEPTLATYREVIECCVAANQVEQSVQILLSMEKRGIKPTVYTFELVISALAKKLQWRRALQLLDLMEESGVPKSVQTYNTLISACARGREIGIAKNLLSRMKKEGVRPSVITYNSLISACASMGRWKDAMNLLDQCNRDPHCVPDIYTYTNAIRACAKAGKEKKALTLYEIVRHKKLPLDSYFYAAVIEAAAKAKLWKRALGLLGEMEDEGIPSTDVVYSLTIKACGNAGRWQEAIKLLDTMRGNGMRINLITYNAAIAALAKAAKLSAKRQIRSQRAGEDAIGEDMLWIRAVELLNQMKADGLRPDGFSFSSAISCCGAEGRWEEAIALINAMTKGGTRPNKVAFTAAIDACGRSGEYMHALRLFRNMTSEGLLVDRVAMNTMFYAFRVAGKADLAFEFWEEMCGPQTGNTSAKVADRSSDRRPTPDIITVTDVIATLSSSEHEDDQGRVDEVFAEAVRRRLVFASNLDSPWEVDLSGMSFPVARAACRFVVNSTRQRVKDGTEVMDVNFITGVGANRASAGQGRSGKPTVAASAIRSKSSRNQEKSQTLSLRDFVQLVLLEDLELKSTVPKLAQGTVQIDKSELAQWIERNN